MLNSVRHSVSSSSVNAFSVTMSVINVDSLIDHNHQQRFMFELVTLIVNVCYWWWHRWLAHGTHHVSASSLCLSFMSRKVTLLILVRSRWKKTIKGRTYLCNSCCRAPGSMSWFAWTPYICLFGWQNAVIFRVHWMEMSTTTVQSQMTWRPTLVTQNTLCLVMPTVYV